MAKVLIVDDEPSIRETLSEFVRETGHEAFAAADANEALEIVAQSRPDVVVCDIVLPGMDGTGLLERIRRIAPDAQVIMVTGEPTVETAADAVRQGAFDYLSKPVSRVEIQATVESALRVKWRDDERTRLEEENARFREHLEEEVERKTRALKASETQYRVLVETADEAVLVAQGGTIQFANPKTMEITGYTEEQLLSMPFAELVHPEDRELIADRYAQELAGVETPSSFEFRILDASGETKWIEIRPVLIGWEGRPATLNLASDVTERRNAVEKLRESEAFLSGVFDAIRAGISVLDADLTVIRTNRWMESMYGDQGPLPGRKCFEVYQQRTAPCDWCPTLRAIETGESQEEVVPYPSADDPRGWIELSSFPIKDETGKVDRVIEYVRDITERVRAERALRASETKWRELFENLRDGWVSTDMDGHFLECNRAYEKLLGYSLEELAEVTYHELTPESWWAYEADIVQRLIVGRGYSGVYEKEYIRKDGTVFPVELSSYLRRDDEGRPIGMWGLARDITERKRAESALVESETRYRTLFDESPTSLWQQDYSATKALLAELRERGIEDVEAHLYAHPAVVDECIERIRVVDVNQAAVDLHRAGSKEDLLGSLAAVIPGESRRDFIPQLVTIAEGGTSFEGVGTDRRFDGSRVDVSFRWIAPPGFGESLSRILVSKVDITAAVEAEAALQAALAGTIEAIGLTTEMRDPYTAGHQRRVTALAVAIAQELALVDEAVDAIRAAGLMHDIGKMAVPAEILSKPSGLSELEMSLIRAHPKVAYDILKRVEFPWPVAEIVLQHHERLDGSGYPEGLTGDAVRREAQILSVADTVEAMASHRPYRAALGIDAALDEIESHRGTQYAADVVDACVRLFREGSFRFPEGTGGGA